MNLSVWNEEVVTRMVELRSFVPKYTVQQIANALNKQFGTTLSHRAVTRRIERLNKALGTIVVSTWNNAMIARLVELYMGDDRPSYTDIARILNEEYGRSFDRNAISGKVNRLKIANRVATRPIVLKVRKPRVRKPVESRARASYSNGQRRMRIVFDAVSPPEFTVVPLEPRLPMLAIVDLEPGDCHWPVAQDGATHFFCGHPRHTYTGSDGQEKCSSYCRHHYLRSIGPGTATERAADRASAAA
jgi:hypothetical protein